MGESTWEICSKEKTLGEGIAKVETRSGGIGGGDDLSLNITR